MAIEVSVLLCTCNRANYLGRALASLEGQTFDRDKFEVVIVDDASRDETRQVISSYAHAFGLSIIRNRTNLGLVESCNCGLKKARGEYLVRLDDDDCFMPNALSKLFMGVHTDNCDLSYSDRYEIDALTLDKTLTKVGTSNLFRWVAIATMMRRSILKRIGGWRPFFWEEYDLYMRFLESSGKKPCYVKAPLFEYWHHGRNMTSRPEKIHKGWQQLIKVWGIEKLRKYGSSAVMEEVYKKMGKVKLR